AAIGRIHLERGSADKALPYFDRASALARLTGVAGTSLLADALDGSALSLTQLQRYPLAERALTQSLALRQTGGDAAGPARRLAAWATTSRYDGRLDWGVDRLREAAAVLANTASDSARRAAIQLRGELNYLKGDMPAAGRDWQEALEFSTHTLRADHPAIAV